jgi:hypothetical protein
VVSWFPKFACTFNLYRLHFGKEALDTLMKEMEDHREDLVVIAAGYIVEMKDLLSQNPGMESRFPTTLHFADYTVGGVQVDINRHKLTSIDTR